MEQETIALLGGTGNEGRGLALRFAAAGFPVLIGSRDAAKAAEAAASITAAVPGAQVRSGVNPAVASQASLVFVCVPFEHAVELLNECRGHWSGDCVVVDTTVPLRFNASGVSLLQLPEPSGSEHLVSRLPSPVPLVAAFKTISAHTLAQLDQPLDCDLIVCGTEQEARARVMAVASRLPGLRVLDGGLLRHARALEAMCALAISLNRRYHAKSARYRIVGV